MYRYFEFAGEKEISVQVSGNAEGELFIKNAPEGEILGKICIHPDVETEQTSCFTGKMISMFGQPKKNWSEYSGKACFPEGKHEIYFEFHGTGSFDFKSFTLR